MHHERIAEPQADIVETKEHLGQGAVHRRHHLVGELVLFDPVSRLEPANTARTAERIQDNITGEGSFESLVLPSRMSDPAFADWVKRAGRLGASPATGLRAR